MLKLKKIALIGASALAVSAVSTVAVQAQPWNHYGYAQDTGRLSPSNLDRLSWRITNAARNGAISWSEARDLRFQLRAVQPLAYRVETGQARPWEVRRLENTVSRIEAATSRYATNDRFRYGERWRR
ncbi:MAG: hypothetical protein ACJ798_08230 [Phenylobacterium sp.]